MGPSDDLPRATGEFLIGLVDLGAAVVFVIPALGFHVIPAEVSCGWGGRRSAGPQSGRKIQQLASFDSTFPVDGVLVTGFPAEELPHPRKDKEDRDLWPTLDSGGHASLITGYNKERGELFTESWGENNRNRRMKAEEREATAYVVFEFQP